MITSVLLLYILILELVVCLLPPAGLPPYISSKGTQCSTEAFVNMIKNDIILGNKDDLQLFKKEIESLTALADSILKAEKLIPINDSSEDAEIWNSILSSLQLDCSWDNAPNLILKYYFYRRVVVSLRYKETNFDPFINKKFSKLQNCMPYSEQLTSRIPELLDLPLQSTVEFLIQASLWGDKLQEELSASMSSTSGSKKRFSALEVSTMLTRNILDDHSLRVLEILMSTSLSSPSEASSSQTSQSLPAGARVRTVDIVLGGAGPDLVADLFLGHMLLRLHCCDRVHFHCRSYPIGEDATNRDFFAAIQTLANPSSSDVWSVRAFGSAARDHFMAGEFVLLEDVFWCQPTAMWDMPEAVQAKLSGSALVFVKGDANYRRLLGDRDWPLDRPAEEVLGYWAPIPVCALRRIESSTGCGIDSSAKRRAEIADKCWQSSGDWAVVQVGGGAGEAVG